ncbi:MAG TPA: glutaredoxin family protein [candidate division Zixibacteria bacterium]|nr:glutaredoxin family protein [candidate division Zixibacteria bacterium]
MKWTKIDGTSVGDIKLFALSTCGWCKKTKALLDELGVEYSFVFVDLLEGDEREEAVKELTEWNPRRSFPTLVFNGEKAIIGFDEAGIRKLVQDA